MKNHRFTEESAAEVEKIGGKTHLWHSKPGFTATDDLLFVRVFLEPGEGHSFHYHPNKEEVIYFINGTAEQWVEDEKQVMGPGSSVYIPKSVVHATFNKGDTPLEFIAVITPASAEGPVTIEVDDRAPV